MSPPETGRPTATPWFSQDGEPAVRDFWAVYDHNYEAISAATMRIARRHPELGPIVETIPAEQLAAQNKDSRDRLRRAMAGDWAQYEANLSEQGASTRRRA